MKGERDDEWDVEFGFIKKVCDVLHAEPLIAKLKSLKEKQQAIANRPFGWATENF